MGDSKYRGYYIAIPLSQVPDVSVLPEKPWYTDKHLSSQYVMFGLQYDRYSFQNASGIVSDKYHTYVCNTLDEFVSYILAYNLNVDLREMFNEQRDKPLLG